MTMEQKLLLQLGMVGLTLLCVTDAFVTVISEVELNYRNAESKY